MRDDTGKFAWATISREHGGKVRVRLLNAVEHPSGMIKCEVVWHPCNDRQCEGVSIVHFHKSMLEVDEDANN